MPILVLDEGSGRAESLLAVPLRARNAGPRAPWCSPGRRGSFSAAAGRVLELVCNQAAAALSTIQLLERTKDMAVRDGLTGLYNRREFDRLLRQAIGREDRAAGKLRAAAARHRPLQEAQRHLRPSGRRRGAPHVARRPEAARSGRATRPRATAARSSSRSCPAPTRPAPCTSPSASAGRSRREAHGRRRPDPDHREPGRRRLAGRRPRAGPCWPRPTAPSTPRRTAAQPRGRRLPHAPRGLVAGTKPQSARSSPEGLGEFTARRA